MLSKIRKKLLRAYIEKKIKLADTSETTQTYEFCVWYLSSRGLFFPVYIGFLEEFETIRKTRDAAKGFPNFREFFGLKRYLLIPGNNWSIR